MSKSHDRYESPLVGRYTSKEMQANWSDDRKFGLWRRLWVAIAEAEQEAGVRGISDGQIEEMRANVDDIDYELAAKIEKDIRHDVMAHVRTFGRAAPSAAGIIHLGCTSCDICDNTELIQMRDGLGILVRKLANLLRIGRDFILKYADLATLGRTHLQAAQPTTVGKRAAMWFQDLLMDLETLANLAENLPFRGLKGATGTQATFLELVEDPEKVWEMELHVRRAFGFGKVLTATGQTYPRKLDTTIIAALANFAASAHKIGLDIRLLQQAGEMEEPFEKDQVGSTAMPHKRNPMRSERVCSLSRELMNSMGSALQTQALQSFERTLDDSAGRRRYLAESFLLADAIVIILTNIFQGLNVYPQVIARNLDQELPFLAGEKIILRMTVAGANRQECHERIRQHAYAAAERVKTGDGRNDLFERIRGDQYFLPASPQLDDMMDPAQYVGLAPAQARNVANHIETVLLQLMETAPSSEKTELTV